MTGHAIVGDLLRGDTITGIDGRTIPAETVTRVETIGDDVAVTTKRGPQRRTTVRHLPATTPVTTDPAVTTLAVHGPPTRTVRRDGNTTSALPWPARC